jgi:hypothetical protein
MTFWPLAPMHLQALAVLPAWQLGDANGSLLSVGSLHR